MNQKGLWEKYKKEAEKRESWNFLFELVGS